MAALNNGYDVQTSEPNLEPIMVSLKRKVLVDTRAILEEVGKQVVAYLQSETAELRPPAETGGAWRHAHPGHWADDTGELARGYTYQVVLSGFEYQLIFRNNTPYAVYVEMHEGFFVLTGIQEPGGPIDQAFDRVVPIIAPTMKWKRRI
jgi:hypothetical protein